MVADDVAKREQVEYEEERNQVPSPGGCLGTDGTVEEEELVMWLNCCWSGMM